MRRKINLLMFILITACVLAACDSTEYLEDMDVSILETIEPMSSEQEGMNYLDYNLYSIEPETDAKENNDYHNSYIEYISWEEFGYTDEEMIDIVEELSFKSVLNEYETYNNNLLKFSLENYQVYDYGILDESDYGPPDDNDAGEVKYYYYDDIVLVDLDNDGIEETLTVSLYKEPNSHSLDQWKITVNGVGLDKEYYAVSPAEQYAIVKIGDKNRIVLSEYGSSLDYFALLFTWEDNSIIDMFSKADDKGLQTLLLPNNIGINIENSDKPIVSADYRLSVLQTWHTKKNYELAGDYLYEIPYEEGYYPTKHPVFLLDDIMLYKEMEDTSDTFIVERGQVVSLTGTDNDKFLRITDNNGESGWFSLEGIDTLECINLFYGLTFYD